jgi:signal transduction histidine kinase
VILRARASDLSTVELTVLEPSAGLSVRELNHVIEEGPMAFDPQRVGGLALGLPLADSIVNMHGGRLEVLDAPGGGLLFRLRLPVDGVGSMVGPVSASGRLMSVAHRVSPLGPQRASGPAPPVR